MAEECTDSSVATSSSTPPNWWDLHPASLSSWSNTNTWNPSNPTSNSSCEEDVSISPSFTNASNHSGLSVESSRRLVDQPASSNEFLGEPTSDNHLWSHVLLSVGSNGELHNSQDVGENLLDALSSKSISTGMFEPACDYLKKMDDSWEFTNSTSLNNFEKHLNGFSENFIESERLTKLSNLVSNWSIAPPDPEINRQFDPQTCNISLNSSMDQYSKYDLCHLKQTFNDSTSCGIGTNRSSTSGPFSCYGHDLKIDNENREIEAPGTLFRRPFNTNGIGYQIGLGSSMVGDNSKYYYGIPNSPTPRNFADVISFSSRFSKPLLDINPVPTPCLKPLNLSDCKKQQGLHNSSSGRINGRGQGITNEGKKKRSEDTSETVLKKPKHENSTVSSVKAPKVKIGDRITALQQIVAPFGKTDTASVLLEAIQYIQFLQEQVKLLSNPYMKTNSHKYQDPWGGLDRKDHKGDVKVDLRSRGLCLVPTSCTPQVYRENTGSDYWTPTYRGCLYR